jgi:hypothetical protein
MSARRLKIIFVAAIILASVIASLAIRYRAEAQLRGRQPALDQQNEDLTRLRAEYQRLSRLSLQTRPLGTSDPSQDNSAELAKLRSEAEALRKQTNELAQAAAENTRAAQLPNIPMPDSRGPRHSGFVISDSDSEEYKEKLYTIGASSPHFGPFNIDARKDAENLGRAVMKYALEHQGQFPSSFQLAAPYFLERYRVPNADEYEIIYQGSLNDLADIPKQAVAIIRERQPWPTPDGKRGRIYVMANNFVKFVESSDNFQSWEAEHLIPPR